MVKMATIQDAASEARLVIDEIRFRPHRPGEVESFRVRLSGCGLDASARVCGPLTADPGAYFAGMAAAWRGWAGARELASDDGALRLEAAADGRGHVRLTMEIVRTPLPGKWRIATDFELDASQLDGLAEAAAKAFSGSLPVPTAAAAATGQACGGSSGC